MTRVVDKIKKSEMLLKMFKESHERDVNVQPHLSSDCTDVVSPNPPGSVCSRPVGGRAAPWGPGRVSVCAAWADIAWGGSPPLQVAS